MTMSWSVYSSLLSHQLCWHLPAVPGATGSGAVHQGCGCAAYQTATAGCSQGSRGYWGAGERSSQTIGRMLPSSCLWSSWVSGCALSVVINRATGPGINDHLLCCQPCQVSPSSAILTPPHAWPCYLQPFNPAQHKVLCEELKHLYTAITRAKNSVIIFDDNPTARAPFYYFLSRLGLSKLVLTSLMEVGGTNPCTWQSSWLLASLDVLS